MEVKKFVSGSQKAWIKLWGRKLLNNGDFEAFRKFEEKFASYKDKEESEEILRFFKFKGELKEGELYYLAQNYFHLLPEEKKGDKNLVISALNNTRKDRDDSDKIIRAMNPKLLEDEDVFTEAMLASSGVLDTYELFSKELIFNEDLVAYLLKKTKGTEISIRNTFRNMFSGDKDFNEEKEFILRFINKIKGDSEIDFKESGKIASNLFLELPRTNKLDAGFAHKYLSILKDNNESTSVIMPLLMGVSYRYNLDYAWFKDFKPVIEDLCKEIPYDVIHSSDKIQKISQGFFNGLYEKNPNILLMLSGESMLVTKELVSDYCGRIGLLKKYEKGDIAESGIEKIRAVGGLLRMTNESNLGMSLLDMNMIDNFIEKVNAGFCQDFLIGELEKFVIGCRSKREEQSYDYDNWEYYAGNDSGQSNRNIKREFEQSIPDRIFNLLRSEKENYKKIATPENEMQVFTGINPKLYNADFYIKLCDEKIWGVREWGNFLERREAYIHLGKDLINFILDSVKDESLEKYRPIEKEENITIAPPVESPVDIQDDKSKIRKFFDITKEKVESAKEWGGKALDNVIGTSPVKKIMWWDWTYSEAEYKKAFMNLEPGQKTMVYSLAKPKYKNDIEITLEMLKEASKSQYNFSVMLGYIESELIMDTPKFIKLLEFLDEANWLKFKSEFDAKNYAESRESLVNKFLLNDEFREAWFKNFGNATILEEIRSNPNAVKTMCLSMLDKEMRNDLEIVQKEEGPSPIVQRKHLKF